MPQSWVELLSRGLQSRLNALTFPFRKPRTALAGVELTLWSNRPIGCNILDYEWDIAIILDTCRVDTLRLMSEEFNFLGPIESVTSAGGATPEWLSQTFTTDHRNMLRDLVYMSGNGFTNTISEHEFAVEDHIGVPFFPLSWDTAHTRDFRKVIHAWKHKGKSLRKLNHPSAEIVTDYAIQYWRPDQPNQMLVHPNRCETNDSRLLTSRSVFTYGNATDRSAR